MALTRFEMSPAFARKKSGLTTNVARNEVGLFWTGRIVGYTTPPRSGLHISIKAQNVPFDSKIDIEPYICLIYPIVLYSYETCR